MDKMSRAGQCGAALFMALIFLLIMTLLGVSGMNQSRLENLMSANNQFQTLALNHAELMLDRGVQSLQKEIGPPYINPAANGRTMMHITTPPAGARSDYSYQFVAEHLGTLDSSASGLCSAASGSGNTLDDCHREVYRVTAMSDTSRGARRTIESVFTAADLM